MIEKNVKILPLLFNNNPHTFSHLMRLVDFSNFLQPIDGDKKFSIYGMLKWKSFNDRMSPFTFENMTFSETVAKIDSLARMLENGYIEEERCTME